MKSNLSGRVCYRPTINHMYTNTPVHARAHEPIVGIFYSHTSIIHYITPLIAYLVKPLLGLQELQGGLRTVASWSL